MTLAYIMDGGLFDGPGAGLDLYEQFPVVRDLYDQVADWVGLEPDRLRRWELPLMYEHREVGAIRQAALTLGICDLLAEHGLRPGVTTGISLGGMVAACVAGAIDRRDLFIILEHLRHAPGPAGPAQAAAALFVPAGADQEEYLGLLGEGAYVAVDCGSAAEGGRHTFLLSGYATALYEAADLLPEGAVYFLPEINVAFHSPLSSHVQDFLEPCIKAIPFRDPEIPVGSCMEAKMLTTAADVREMFLRNQTAMVSLPHMFANLMRQDVEMGVLVGPGNIERFPGGLPFPVIHVETSEQIADSLTTIYELGIQFSVGF